MTAQANQYITLSQFQESLRAGGAASTSTLGANTPDDADIESYIFQASRAIDTYTRRKFYIWRQTRVYDKPNGWDLKFDEDLIDVIELENGNDIEITASKYTVYSPNFYPRYKLSLIQTSGAVWQYATSGNNLNVIDLDALWGYHDDYQFGAWELATAVNNVGGYSASATSMTVDTNTVLQQGNTIRFGALSTSEFARVATVTSATAIVVVRGVNGSTAATQADDAAIYVYRPMGLIQNIALRASMDIYRKRTGALGDGGAVTLTAAGVVIRPQGLPVEVRDAFEALTRRQ